MFSCSAPTVLRGVIIFCSSFGSPTRRPCCKPVRSSTTGQLSIEDVPTMILCKPKLLPLKSVTLEKLEKMQMEAQVAVRQQELAAKEQLQ